MSDTTTNPVPEVLNQSDIDRLLAASTEMPKPVIFRADGRRLQTAEAPKIETYDFRNPVFLAEAELRRLRLLHEDFIRYLSARLSLFLRMEFGLKMAKLTTLSYGKFTETLPNPTHICLFKTDPLPGVGILDINPRLALSLVDRMLGGTGKAVAAERYLTEIEVTLLEDIIVMILEEWCSQWKDARELHPAIIGHESSGRFLQTSTKDAVVLTLTMEATFGECSEQIQIGMPYFTIEPLVKNFQASREKEGTPAAKAQKAEWKPVYEHISLPVRAEWDAFELSLREITELRVGDIIELPTGIVEHTTVKLNGSPKFSGTVGLDGETVVVKLTQKILPEHAPNSKHHGR
ncbi:MAG: FliM/FliN family flagellar motor switch protein [Opitutaceae bacterium]|nr:FliM/FliN family flagellar motor switch protein [Opitutaceae bacterium]